MSDQRSGISPQRFETVPCSSANLSWLKVQGLMLFSSSREGIFYVSAFCISGSTACFGKFYRDGL